MRNLNPWNLSISGKESAKGEELSSPETIKWPNVFSTAFWFWS